MDDFISSLEQLCSLYDVPFSEGLQREAYALYGVSMDAVKAKEGRINLMRLLGALNDGFMEHGFIPSCELKRFLGLPSGKGAAKGEKGQLYKDALAMLNDNGWTLCNKQLGHNSYRGTHKRSDKGALIAYSADEINDKGDMAFIPMFQRDYPKHLMERKHHEAGYKQNNQKSAK